MLDNKELDKIGLNLGASITVHEHEAQWGNGVMVNTALRDVVSDLTGTLVDKFKVQLEYPDVDAMVFNLEVRVFTHEQLLELVSKVYDAGYQKGLYMNRYQPYQHTSED